MSKHDFKIVAGVLSTVLSAYWIARPSDYLSRNRAILGTVYGAANVALLVQER